MFLTPRTWSKTRLTKHFKFSAIKEFQRNQGYGWGIQLGALAGLPSDRLLEGYFWWSLAEKSRVIRPLGVDLEGVSTVPFVERILLHA